MGLRNYQSMRNFRSSPEPKGKAAKSGSRRFVIQKHAARNLHYDFRLEANGVLVSWAVPKGLPTDRGEKRLAVHVEDHPVAYANFEGIIPRGNYGAGSVMVWDLGRYEAEGDLQKMMAKGKVDFTLHGKKLQGAWTLVRSRGLSGKDPWLVIKREKSLRPLSARQEDRSALSGRSMAQIAEQQDAVWQSHRKASSRAKSKPRPISVPLPKGLPPAKPVFQEPMKAKLVDELARGKDWVYEIKFDGVRALATLKDSKIQLLSRNKIDRADRYSAIAAAVQALPCRSAVLDGEIVALDAQGRSSFQKLQESLDPWAKHRSRIFYYLFDLLQLNGHDLQKLSLVQRKEILARLLKKAPDPLRYSAHFSGDAGKIIRQVRKLDLEGVVGKRGSSHYEAGRRSGAWIKWKLHQSQEFVIGGYTRPRGNRPYFGALLVGYYEKGKLVYSSKVGTGFDAALLRSLFQKLKSLATETCPFSSIPAEVKNSLWVRPKLVAQLKFQEWTRDGGLRQPVFLGLRDDRKPSEVRREVAIHS